MKYFPNIVAIVLILAVLGFGFLAVKGDVDVSVGDICIQCTVASETK